MARNQTCFLCGLVFDAPAHAGDYGLCPGHWSRDVLRELDRLVSARRHVEPGAPNTLQLQEWLAITGRWNGLCAICQEVPYSAIGLLRTEQGLTATNALPACHRHLRHGWHNAFYRLLNDIEQVTMGSVAPASLPGTASAEEQKAS